MCRCLMTGSASQASQRVVPDRMACAAQPPANPSGPTTGNQGPLLLPTSKLMTSWKKKLHLILGGDRYVRTGAKCCVCPATGLTHQAGSQLRPEQNHPA